MANTLDKMEQTLQEYKDRYQVLKTQYTSIQSAGGTSLTIIEDAFLRGTDDLINKLEEEVVRRKKILANITISDVKDHYGLLYKRIHHFISKEIDGTYLKWQDHILSVGTCYANAYKTFQDTVEAQKKYKADLANIAGSVISIAGIGTLSWLSTTGKLATVLVKLSEQQQNIAEDIGQGIWDKGVSYIAGKSSSTVTKDFSGPLIFQNKISKKVLNSYMDVRNEMLKHEGAAIECEAAMLKLQTQKKGDARKEYEKYIAFEAVVAKAIMEVNKWVKNTPNPVQTVELEKDFERGFWAGWLPRLKSYKTVRISTYDEFGVRDPNAGSYKKETIDAWMSSALTDRLTALINLEAIGVGKNGLDWWVSQNDVLLLIGWANKFKPTQKF